MSPEEEFLSQLPFAVLLGIAQAQNLDAGWAHSRIDLVHALARGHPLPPNPMKVIRSRVHQLIKKNWQYVEHHIDEECKRCFENNQQSCHDLRALADYLSNLPMIQFDPKE